MFILISKKKKKPQDRLKKKNIYTSKMYIFMITNKFKNDKISLIIR